MVTIVNRNDQMDVRDLQNATMLANHRLVRSVFLFMLVFCVTWIALSAAGAVDFRKRTASANDPKLGDGLSEQMIPHLVAFINRSN